MKDKNLNIDFFKIKSNNVKPKKGRVLIAEPFANDFFFTRSVVLLTEYSPNDGAMGFILNKPMSIDEIPSEIFEEFGANHNLRVYYGGPVGTNQLFYLHNLPETILPGSIEILPGLYWGGDYREISKLLKEGALSNNNIKFFVGYSGWAPKQLENEIEKNLWVIADTNAQEILGDEKELWKRKLIKLGPRYAIWTHYSKNPELN